MSRGGEVLISCWDGEYTFRLRIGELRQLQEKCDAGPLFIARRLVEGSWRVDDIRETLRLGLIGGGTKQQDALRLVEAHVDVVPWAENVVTAQTVILAAVYGSPEERLGEQQAAEGIDLSNEERSASPPTMDPASSSE